MIGRREFVAGAIGAVTALRMKGADLVTAPVGRGGLVLASGAYADFGQNEKWIQIAPKILIDSQRFSKPTLNITSALGSPARVECTVGAPPSRLVQVDIYVEDPATCARFDVMFSSNDFAGWITKMGINVPFVAGWNRLQFSVNDCVAQGAGMTIQDWDKVNKVRLVLISKPGTTANVWVGGFRWLRTKAAVTFTWDDGREGCQARAMPMMLQYGWASTIYVVTQAIDKKTFTCSGGGVMNDPLTLDQLKSLQDAGWDISSHTATHPRLSKLPSDQKRFELESAKEWLLKNKFGPGARFFATPYGNRDAETQAVAKAVYENLRDASEAPTAGYETPLNLNGAVSTRYSLRFQELPSGEGKATFRQFQSWVETAIASGTWLIIVGHTVDDGGGWLDPNLFRRFLAYLDTKRDDIDVLTMSQYWDRRNESLDQFSLSISPQQA